MKNRKTETYIQFLKKIKEIFAIQYPTEPPLSFAKVSADFEKAFILSVQSEMPQAKLQLCFFHFLKIQSEKIQKMTKTKFYNVAPLSYLFKLLRSIAYVPWLDNPSLIDVFFEHIEYA